jgi:hypothetical protein
VTKKNFLDSVAEDDINYKINILTTFDNSSRSVAVSDPEPDSDPQNPDVLGVPDPDPLVRYPDPAPET